MKKGTKKEQKKAYIPNRLAGRGKPSKIMGNPKGKKVKR